MITRADVQRVVDAFLLEETLYWWEHPIERVNTVRGIGCLGWVSLVNSTTIGARPRLGLPQALHGQHERNVFKRDHGRPDSVRVPPLIPRILDGMPPRRHRRRQRASTRRPCFRQNGRGIMSVLAKAYKIGDKLGRDKRYKRRGAKGATGHYRRHPRPWES